MVLLRGLCGACRLVGRQLLASGWAGRPEAWQRPEPWSLPAGTQTSPRRRYASRKPGMKVTICGALGCTGQPLALLLKQCPLIEELALYDQYATCGIGVELSHVDTAAKISSYSGKHMLCDALKDSSVVVIVAKHENFNTFDANAPIVTEIALQCCNVCPTAFTIVGTEPVESLVPLVGEIQRLRSVYDPRKLMGCVELHCVRANTVLADFLRVPPESVHVPVIGGATPRTMVPVLSTACHPGNMSQAQVECVTACIMGGTAAVCCSKGCCTAVPCLAGAFAIARTTINVVKGLQGAKVVQCGYVDSLGTCAPCCQFFAVEVVLGPSGIEKIIGVPELSKFEHCLLTNALPLIRNEQCRAIWLVYQMSCLPGVQPYCAIPCYRCQAPPVNWTCECPDPCRDEYLASICKRMTCTCTCEPLVWKPRSHYDPVRATNLRHTLPPPSHDPCNYSRTCMPRSVAMQKHMLENARNPCARATCN